MKILSLNVRGFAVEGKFGWVKNICYNERPSIAVFKEIKCRNIEYWWVESLWGNRDFGYVQKDVVGNSGGLLIVWDTSWFEVSNAMINDYFLAIKGCWKNLGKESIIVNVYGPHCDSGKRRFWNYLDGLLNSCDTAWVICEDFNEVRDHTDILNSDFIQHRANWFNDFISRNNLIDIPINGKKFTRVNGDGVKLSKLDKFFVSDRFLQLWEDLSTIALDRFLSNHFPIILRDKVIDFGPKPFKIFDEWLFNDGVDKVIEKAWALPVKGCKLD
ncbi:uncharacterized protein [Rutidosis leptorrhynchoides]|uniref:uncharacterized protein n=1 Tax=Rutidosis leptorrhynchoides TaxID=125765 RepID=UPI003A9A16EC